MTTIVEKYGCECSGDVVRATTLLVGMECEIETVQSWKAGPSKEFFNITDDGSLRNNGKEFISIPLSIDKAIPAFKNLHADLKCGTGKFSERTSVHVHVNCTNLELETVRNTILMYALFEEFFFKMVDPSRRHNIHCVPLTETYLSNYYGGDLSLLIQRWHKYTALNIKPLSKLGTMEFRHMHGHDDPELMAMWLTAISNLFNTAKEIKLNRELLKTAGNKQFLFDHIFGDVPVVAQHRNLIDELTFNTALDVKLAL